MRRAQARPGRKTLSEQIRDLIFERQLTGYEVAQSASLNRSIVNRFLAGSPASGDTLDALADALGLKLVEPTRRAAPARRPGPSPVRGRPGPDRGGDLGGDVDPEPV